MKSKHILTLIIVALALVSCATKKNLGPLDTGCFVAQGTVTVTTGSRNVSAPARLSLERGKMMRLQVMMPLLGSEIFRAEFTPDGLLVIDKMNRRFMAQDYAELDAMTGLSIDYARLQSQVIDYLRRQEPISLPVPGKGRVTMKGEFDKIKPSDEPLQPSSTAKYTRIEPEDLLKTLMNLK